MSTRRSRGFLLLMKQLVFRDFRTPIAGVYLTAQHPSHSHSPSGSVMRCRCPAAIQQRFLSLDPWARESLGNTRSLTAGDRNSLALWFRGEYYGHPIGCRLRIFVFPDTNNLPSGSSQSEVRLPIP